MLTLHAGEGTAPRVPLNLALVLDASGSMSGEKIARAKEAAGFAVRQLGSADQVAVVAYSDDVTMVAPSTTVTAAAKTDLLYRIGRIDTGGTTNLSGGWLTGCQELARIAGDEREQRRVLVLTDGLANVGITNPEELVEHARQLRLRGIVTSTMGVGADFNEELLEALARQGGGRFQYVETAKHVPDCVQGELGEMLQVSARKVAVEIRLPPSVRCQECLNDYVRDDLPDGMRLHLGDLAVGETRRVLLKLVVEPARGVASLALDAVALYVDVASGRGTDQPFPRVELRVAPDAEVEREEPRADVAQEVALQLAAQAKEAAARLSREGDDLSAVQVLAQARVTLSASPFVALAPIADELTALGNLADEASRGLDRRQVKEMHYQSYLTKQARRRYDPPT
jgi:Ca-activated chloride channel family protein